MGGQRSTCSRPGFSRQPEPERHHMSVRPNIACRLTSDPAHARREVRPPTRKVGSARPCPRARRRMSSLQACRINDRRRDRPPHRGRAAPHQRAGRCGRTTACPSTIRPFSQIAVGFQIGVGNGLCSAFRAGHGSDSAPFRRGRAHSPTPLRVRRPAGPSGSKRAALSSHAGH